ncbi:uridine diphosphate glucose pyrophosphatase NUDT14 isoform X4 [Canis lupus baileyi]|uniref:Nudix hydrolase 14 n=2 Tax=Canis lupus familiaris TaxID=9615 RepID=A0A8P0PQK8_CANLF|nr:uridine diphosphate glucose pyrophosphatase NUDT14 isoform X3 [Canis lupus familiaris]XP_038453023.1 uridine diphosphate glucose pyrophosphatase NUDT14 isoform X3 [Canis lupus familiaris]XP_038530767.1 uridine diphosphate glucose pyrophosphatase NUDT14 isoform X3 [Canis lupus familiaris]
MERIEGAAVGRCAASPYLRPLTLHYRQGPPTCPTRRQRPAAPVWLLPCPQPVACSECPASSTSGQNGAQKSWDFMKTHDSVAILMFNSSQQSLVLVKQFRPAVYVGEVERRFPGSLAAVDQDRPQELQVALPGSAGVTYELCAGLVDQPGLSLEEVACSEAWEECGYRLAPSDLRRVATYKGSGGRWNRRHLRSRSRPEPRLLGAVVQRASAPTLRPLGAWGQLWVAAAADRCLYFLWD